MSDLEQFQTEAERCVAAVAVDGSLSGPMAMEVRRIVGKAWAAQAERIRELEEQLAATNEAYRMRDLEAREVSSFFKAECAEYRSKISSLEAKINGAQLCGEHVNAILSDEELPVHRGCVVCALVLQAESDEQRLEKVVEDLREIADMAERLVHPSQVTDKARAAIDKALS